MAEGEGAGRGGARREGASLEVLEAKSQGGHSGASGD